MECVKVEINGNIEIRYIKESKNSFTRMYKLKGRILPRIILEGHRIEQMKAFSSLDKDLRNIMRWVSIINRTDMLKGASSELYPSSKNDEAFILKGLYVAILTMYGRCFTTAEGRRFTFDKKKHIPEEFKELHEDIMHARNNFAAHKGNFVHEDYKIALAVDENKRSMNAYIFAEIVQPFMSGEMIDSRDTSQAFLKICEHLKGIVNKKYDDLCQKIIDEFVYKKDFGFWPKKNGQTVTVVLDEGKRSN